MLGFRHVCHLTLISLCIAADLKNTHFTNPPAAGSETFYDEDVTFHLNSNERLQWTTDMSSYSIYLWQQVLTEAAAKVGDAIFAKASGQPEPGEVTWNVSLEGQPLLLSDSNVFFFSLGPNNSLNDVTATSHYFNITNQPATTTTTFSSGPTATVPAASLNSTTPIVTPTSTPSSSSSSVSKVGLGVGLGVGIPIILLLGALVYFRWRSLHHGRSGPNKSDSPTWQPMLPTEGTAREGYPNQHASYMMNDMNKMHKTNELMAEGNVRTELPAERAPEEPSELAGSRT